MRRWFLAMEVELLRCLFLWFYKDRKDFFEQYKDEFCFDVVTVSAENEEVKKVIYGNYSTQG